MWNSLLTAAVFCFLSISPKEGAKFPELQGESLEGKTVSLPSACSGKKAIIGLAYSEKAQEALMTWHEPMFDKFIAKVGMFDKEYDVSLFFVPMFIGLKQALYESTLKKLKAENRKDLYPYVIFYKGELEPYGSLLDLKDKSLPYFFVLDENGKVVKAVSGSFSEHKMEQIEMALE
jgi:hypothetical protein